jgi:hypothetical protein
MILPVEQDRPFKRAKVPMADEPGSARLHQWEGSSAQGFNGRDATLQS